MVITKVVDHWNQLAVGLNRVLHFTPKPLLEQLMGQTLNHFFKPERQRQQFEFLHQRWVKISIPDLSLIFAVTADNTSSEPRLRVSMRPQQAAVTMRGDSATLLMLISGECDPDTLFFRRKLLLTGDTELGLAVKNLLDTVELEGRLPRFAIDTTKRVAQGLHTPSGVSNF